MGFMLVDWFDWERRFLQTSHLQDPAEGFSGWFHDLTKRV